MNKIWGRIGLAALIVPQAAFAHSPIPGIEGFYAGAFHPFSTPSQVLLMVGLGLLLGNCEISKVRWHIGTFFAAILLGVFLGHNFPSPEITMFAVAFATYAWAALSPRKIPLSAIILTAIGGITMGIASIPDLGPTKGRMITTTGSIIGANMILLYLWGIVLVVKERFTWEWVTIALRVIAAWLGAISLIMLALQFSTN